MRPLRLWPRLVVLSLSCLFSASVAPVAASQPPACRWAEAKTLGMAGDRYRERGRNGDAARSYLAAERLAHECPTTGGRMLDARLLAQSGTALAQTGDYLRALPLLRTAQSQLSSLVAADAANGDGRARVLDVVQGEISLIEGVARASM